MRNSRVLGILLVLALLLPAGVFTAGTTTGNRTVLSPDGKPHHWSGTAGTDYYFDIRQERFHSYQLELYNRNNLYNNTRCGPMTVFESTALTTDVNSEWSNTQFNPPSVSNSWAFERRNSISTATSSDPDVVEVTPSVTATCSMRFIDTTMISPYFFVGSGYNAWAIVTSAYSGDTGPSCTVSLTMFSLDGTKNFTLPDMVVGAGQTGLVNLDTYEASLGDFYGSVLLAHDCPHGAVRAHLANQHPSAPSTVMTDFEPVVQVSGY